ncbi:MAG: apolipoprotein N-acyltransferase [Candidatus Kapabacteria bacterium]|jgi:apolipoprotein N-acyltransferase|nr:apolipoprotein N-acyltransferase [Candidatus Kapabacteria bacterium]
MKFPRLPDLRTASYLTLSGFLLGIGFAPTWLGILAYLGFVPLLLVLERTEGVSQTLRRLYWTFFVFHGVSNWWVSSWQREADPYLMAAGIALWLGHPFFFAVPMLGYTFIRKRLGRAAALGLLPFLWTAFEWLHGLGEASYPWQALGYTQIFYTPLVQIADVTGVWGLSFVVVLFNSLAAWLVFSVIAQSISGETPLAVRITKALYLCRFQIVLGIGVLLALLGYGMLRVRDFSHDKLSQRHAFTRVGIIQPNINPWGKWQGSPQEQVLLHLHLADSLRMITQKTVQKSTTDTASNLDFVLWSETAIPYRILLPQNSAFLEMLRQWTDSTKTAIVSGLPSDRLYKRRADAPLTASVIPRMFDTIYAESFNSAMVLAPGSNIAHSDVLTPYPPTLPIHRKMKLTPLAERVPYAETFAFAVKALTWGVGISGWGLGREQKPLPLVREKDTVQIGMVICIESIYPAFVAEYARKGANILAVITNDGWFNHTPGPEQHYMIAAMRAVESKRYVVRCGNTGISGVLTPLGTSLHRTTIDTQAVLAETVPLLDEQTLYAHFGDWLPETSCLLVLVVIVWAWWKFRHNISS